MLECLSVLGAIIQRSRSRITALLMALTMLSWLPLAHASLRDTPKPRPRSTVLSSQYSPIAYDFDGDFRSDHVILESNGFDKTISIKFGTARNSELGFTAKTTDRGSLVADDIDHDGDLDLIWVGNVVHTAIVFINDGKGDFTEAKDNAPYASELNALFSSGDPADQHFLQASPQIYSLTSSSFADIDFAVASRFAGPSLHVVSLAGFDGFATQQSFLACFPKRGPPPTLS